MDKISQHQKNGAFVLTEAVVILLVEKQELLIVPWKCVLFVFDIFQGYSISRISKFKICLKPSFYTNEQHGHSFTYMVYQNHKKMHTGKIS